MHRRDLLKMGIGSAAAMALSPLIGRGQAAGPATVPATRPAGALITKAIPSSGEKIPVIGVGTARRYQSPAPADRAELKEVLRLLPELGCTMIDTAPSYGNAEEVVGALVSEIGNRNKLFLATKVSARGKEAGLAQIEQSFQKLKTDKIDLIAVHNLTDTDIHLATLRELKAKGRIRYFGATTSSDGQYGPMETLMKAQEMDFIQVDYAIDNREVEARILPLAIERKMAVMVNLPLGRGRVFEAVQGKPLPEWAKEFDCATWAQFFLKYLVSHPAVTCAIPGTARVSYVHDNTAAARGRLPDADMRKKMEQFIAGV
jgi:aryl-alcohol dehydrogenase-like predicted oxidoreductase